MAGLLALALLVPAGIGAGLAFLLIVVSAAGPDPSGVDGEPCCALPDTWGEVVEGFALAAGTLVWCAAWIYAAVAPAVFAWSGSGPSPQRLRRLGFALSYVVIWLVIVFTLA